MVHAIWSYYENERRWECKKATGFGYGRRSFERLFWFMVRWVYIHSGYSNILTVELWAIYYGFILCWNKGFRRAELESDSLVVVKKILKQPSRNEANFHLITAIQELQQCNWICSIRHVHMEANVCADWIATYFEHLNLGLHLFNSHPSDIAPLLMADAMGVIWPRLM
ncbi:hypothetical protein REPUB_Repub03eG0033200 [Reevesia pubescens]